MKPLDLAGQKFNRLTAINSAGRDKRGILWRCICECGTEVIVRGSNLPNGNVKSCGCLLRDFGKRKLIDISGRTFGRLKVIKHAGKKGNATIWLCVCDCDGREVLVQAGNLQNGHTKSCGCLAMESLKERSLTHGHSHSPAYKSWSMMKNRCLNPNATQFEYYGALGITVCERWKDFAKFLEDVGERPQGTTLGRFGDIGNYEPGNVKWMTPAEQGANFHPDRNKGPKPHAKVTMFKVCHIRWHVNRGIHKPECVLCQAA